MQNSKSPEEDLDIDMLVESELVRLKRQYRIMENDRKTFYEEMNIKLAKQRAIIQTLKHEKSQLLTDLKVATSASRKRYTRAISAKITKIYSNYENYMEVIDKERNNLKEINEQIWKLEKKIDQVRHNDVTENQFKTRLQSGKKSVELLENKLQTFIKRFCATITENKTLRNELDHLLKERSNFNKIWEKLLLRMNEGKKLMLNIIEEAIQAYDSREELCAKLQALKIQAKNDEILHTQDLREMQRILNHDSKLKEFLSVKAQRRLMKDLELKEQIRREDLMKTEEKQVEMYEETVRKIQEFCEERDIERIVSKYLKQEEENFALFNYVNELQQEQENLSKELDGLQTKLDEQKVLAENDEKNGGENSSMINEMLEKTLKEAEIVDENLNEMNVKVDILLKGILELFTLLQCDQVPILELIGDSAKINVGNVMIYVSLIEKRISELITLAFVTCTNILDDDEENLRLNFERIA